MTMSQTDPSVNDTKTPASPAAPAPAAEPAPLAPIASSENLDADVESELNKALEGKSVEQFMDANTGEKTAPVEEGESKSPKRIEIVVRRGRITEIRQEDVFVELYGVEGKNTGVVPLRQFDRPPRLGSMMDFVVERYDETEGFYVLNREGAVTKATWDQLTKGSIVEARVVAHNKGGLELEMVGSIRAFMPAGQIDFHHIEKIEECVGQRYTAVVQEINHKAKRVVLSRRAFLEQERRAKKEKLLAEIEVGQTREGKIVSIAEYGAFVDLGGVDGLIHISDMSYKRINKASEVVKVGDAVKVKILKLDKDKERLSLGLKQVEPDPWEGLADRIKPGETVSSRVVKIADFGVFVEVETGVEGLVPASELSWKRNIKTNELVKDGDIIKLLVMAVDPDKRRITLSLKQAGGDPWADAASKYGAGANVEAVVTKIADFGAFVEVEQGIEGLVHISELSDKRVNTVGDVVKVGLRYQFRVLEIDTKNHRLRLSLKATKEPVKTPEEVAAEAKAAAKAATKKVPAANLKGGMGKNAGLGIGLRDLKL